MALETNNISFMTGKLEMEGFIQTIFGEVQNWVINRFQSCAQFKQYLHRIWQETLSWTNTIKKETYHCDRRTGIYLQSIMTHITYKIIYRHTAPESYNHLSLITHTIGN